MDSSNYKVFKQKERKIIPKFFIGTTYPCKIVWEPSKQADILLANGLKTVGSCLRCKNAPCINYTEKEIRLTSITEFPAEINLNVCPVNAISWPLDKEAPVIDKEICIGCGLCVSRCPVCAISFDDLGIAVINDVENKFFVKKDKYNEKSFNDNIEIFMNTERNGFMKNDTDKILGFMYSQIDKNIFRTVGNFPNLLVRNLLIELGIRAAIRRRGDTNIRMDLLFELAPSIGVSEVEFGEDILNTPRNLLDNIAVLHSRYGYGLKNVMPVAFSLILPNQRSEYWQVINDINKILNIKIKTITIGVLAIMLWNNLKLNAEALKLFYIDVKNLRLRDATEALLGRSIKISEHYFGVIEPQK
jgi:NAD-dependent dihydropyrimidine dehydrogenase PreA subunit